MKKAISLLLTVLFITAMFAGCGAKGADDGGSADTKSTASSKASSMDYFQLSFDGTKIYKLTDEGNKQKELVIPAQITSMSSSALDDNDVIEKLSFENPDFELCENMCWGCTTLKEIILPENITEIPEYCFSNCSSLKSIVIPDSVTTIGKRAFGDCTSLESVTFGSSVQTIGEDAFRYCDSLTEIILNEGVETLESCAFADCHNLQSVKLPASLTSIDVAFAHTGTHSEEYAKVTFYVVKDSWADKNYDEYASSVVSGSYGEKAYY